MRALRKTLLVVALGVAGAGLGSPPEAEAAVVERVVAIVGERAILLSDLRERARPFLVRVYSEVPPGAQRAAAISELYKQLVERMVDEELQQRAANRARIVVAAQEVDQALARVAAQNGMPVEQLVAEARRTGLTEQQYRNEIRRQVLEAKLMNLRLQGRIRITEQDLRAAYRDLVMQERRRLAFRLAWVTIDTARTNASELAERIAEQAQAGADFAELARRYSSDADTRKVGGLLPTQKPGSLPASLDRAALGLDVGEVSSPLRLGSHFVVLKLVERQQSQLPDFEEARSELGERVYLEKMTKARQHWLDGLRRRTHVEVRL
jgi:peptidyl-prolyl cis-trans isomerase SurA